MKHIFLLLALFITASLSSQEDVNNEFIEWVEDNNIEETKNYLGKGADINYQDKKGRNAAFYALENADGEALEIFHYLLSKGINVKAVDNNDQNTLHFAASNGATAFVDTLITLGVDINAKDNKGYTPIMYAAEEDNFEIIHKLAINNANLSLLDEDEESVLKKIDLGDADWEKLAQYNWNQEQLNYLLFYQVGENQNPKIIEKFIKKGANVNASHEGVPLVLLAAEMVVNENIIKLLLDNGMEVNVTDEDNKNVLWFADNTNIFKLFISKGANVNQKDSDGYSILHDAIKWGIVEYVEALVEAKANVNIDSPEGTPLAYSKTLNDLPSKNVTYKDEALRQQHLDDYMTRIKTIQKILKKNGAK